MSRRLDNLAPDRQKRLFESAAEEFAAHGFDGASLNRILAQSGMSKSSLYYYFDDKADLFVTVIERTMTILFKEIGGLDLDRLAAETFWTTFEELYARAVVVINASPWLVRFGGMFYALRGRPEQGATTGRVFAATRGWVTTILARGQELGVIRRDLPQALLIDAAMSLLETLDRWSVRNWAELDVAARAALPAEHVALMRRLLSP